MTPEQIALVQRSFDQLAPPTAAFAQQFYQQLFALDPTLRPLFAVDTREQEQSLTVMVTTLVSSLWHPESLTPVLQQLGQRHAGYGVLAANYATAGEALIATLRLQLGQQFTPEVEAAWRVAYSFIAATMQRGSVRRAVGAT